MWQFTIEETISKHYLKHRVSNIFFNDKNVDILIENILKSALCNENYPFLNALHSKINDLQIPFKLSAAVWNDLHKW